MSNPSPEKSSLHLRNKHRERYDFQALIASCPDLGSFVSENKYGDESVDFFDPKAVLLLNKALLKHHYQIHDWEIPAGYLCPPIPGRADYIHYLADLLGDKNFQLQKKRIPSGAGIVGLDIGVGANAVYPLIGTQEYGWSFIGSDIDPKALDSAQKVLERNALLDRIELRLQSNPRDIFQGILKKGEMVDFTMCNPPFHASAEEAQAGSLRKQSNLKGKKQTKSVLNFGGQNNELWCEGGELKFVGDMIFQSKAYSNAVFWFSTLISKQAHLEKVYSYLEKAAAVEVKTIAMSQGNKSSRMVAWTFLTPDHQKRWTSVRWK
jgi:23S rRNA (adenine1618-N6)-methyltransferase